MVFLNLFFAFFKIGLFAIGGAYSFIPLIEKEIVEKYSWLTREEFLDVMGITIVFPGAISIKYATYTGYKMAGIPGAVVSNLGNFLAPAVLIILASVFYSRYKNIPSVKSAFNLIQLAVFAMIIAVAFRLVNLNQLMQLKGLLVIIPCFIIAFYTKTHPAIIIVTAGLIGAFLK